MVYSRKYQNTLLPVINGYGVKQSMSREEVFNVIPYFKKPLLLEGVQDLLKMLYVFRGNAIM